MKQPQSDIPTEVIIHYIVKDYQRMFNSFHAMRDEKQAYIDKLLKELGRKSATISALQAENKRLRKEKKKKKKAKKISDNGQDY